MKQYTVTVELKPEYDPGTPFVFTSPEAYLQAKSGQDIHAVDSNSDEVYIPRHAIADIAIEAQEAEYLPPADDFCNEGFTLEGEVG